MTTTKLRRGGRFAVDHSGVGGKNRKVASGVKFGLLTDETGEVGDCLQGEGGGVIDEKYMAQCYAVLEVSLVELAVS